MTYTSKQLRKNIDPTQKKALTSPISMLSDQRASTAVQLKQQQIMQAAHSPNVIQQISAEDEPLQGKFESETPTQLQESAAAKPNNTGLPDNLKSGIENLSGYSMDDVKVHYNSAQPAQLNAHAYAQGTDIHVAPGQEQHLPHEAWHVVQQKQGRVQPTMQMKAGVPVNDDAGLEHEADVMGAKALQLKSIDIQTNKTSTINSPTAQLVDDDEGEEIEGGIGAQGFRFGTKDFGKFSANEEIDPDQIGEENNGIRELQEDQMRPDDVPQHQEYRLAMHMLHDVIMVLEDRGPDPEVDTAVLRQMMVDLQSEAKGHAKTYKSAMRNVTSNETQDNLQQNYLGDMDDLARDLLLLATHGKKIIEDRGYLEEGESLKETGTELWRERWLQTKGAVDRAITRLWRWWRNTLKAVAKNHKGDASPNTPGNQRNWEQRIDNENWEIFYGGSLMKGYKGPPKQNTRFLASNFDVDANMDAPAIAEFLINERGKKVDRGQLDPAGAGTRIEDMNKAMDTEVKRELVESEIVENEQEANEIVSEEFETRVNAPDTLGNAARVEVIRSSEEQRVRDKLTGVRKQHPERMIYIGYRLGALLQDEALVMRPLTAREIEDVEDAIDRALA
ncbi:eCIS core domain-containing protein [Cellvibrio sp. OA-2007]|uniref:eCIS core domain-containing protein n=1 Tax=Cellvibrio sp. OA-2007 TaxID=529823 RepID=UPI000B319D57|nr:DUF4157 domain-containing protein [Cellvibrio sp. OA-2007]